MAFKIFLKILKAIFLLEKHLVGTYKVYIIAGHVDTMDILCEMKMIDNIKLLII